MGRPSNREARRRQIRHALLKVMAEKGYDGASIADVAEAAGLGPGLVHYHYASKLEILLDLLERLDRNHRRRLEEAIAAAGDDPWERIDVLIDAHLATDRADPNAVAVWTALGGEALKDARVQSRFEAALRSIRAILEPLLVEAGFSNPRAAAAAILAAVQGYLVLGVTTDLVPAHSAAPYVKAMARGSRKETS